mmetsp:Transcript_3925/g.9541  ORF Transcript_3925/g.9541 Transcript_3925/m.9541 type:complete len:496 (+) Transcript_3925:1788-3275(+)|eukprot:g19860.t1
MVKFVQRLFAQSGTDWENECHWRKVSWMASRCRDAGQVLWKLGWARVQWLFTMRTISENATAVEDTTHKDFCRTVDEVTAAAETATTMDEAVQKLGAEYLPRTDAERTPICDWASAGLLHVYRKATAVPGLAQRVRGGVLKTISDKKLYFSPHDYHYPALEFMVFLFCAMADDEFLFWQALSIGYATHKKLQTRIEEAPTFAYDEFRGDVILLVDVFLGLYLGWTMEASGLDEERGWYVGSASKLVWGFCAKLSIHVQLGQKVAACSIHGIVMPEFSPAFDQSAPIISVSSLTRVELNAGLRVLGDGVWDKLAASDLAAHDAVRRDVVRKLLIGRADPAKAVHWNADKIKEVRWDTDKIPDAKRFVVQPGKQQCTGNDASASSSSSCNAARSPRKDLGRILHPFKWKMQCDACNALVGTVYQTQLKQNAKQRLLYMDYVASGCESTKRITRVWPEDHGEDPEQHLQLFSGEARKAHKCTKKDFDIDIIKKRLRVD